jgi:crotonobetainyl-CoA:carnitine CoA-transferase CaiB-like acyl-CoA transferase
VGTPIIDAASGQQLTVGILAALVHRAHSGHGQHVEVSLLDTAIDLQAQEFTTYLNCDVEPHRSASGIAHPHFVPPYGIYATQDGYMALAHTPISRLVEFFGLPSRFNELASGTEVFEHRDEIFALLSSVIRSRTTREWLDDLRAHDFWCGPVHSYRELANDPQVRLNEMIIGVPYKDKQTARVIGIPVKFSNTPGSIRRTPPEVGQHTTEILTELGVPPDEIESLRTEHAV